MAETRKHRTVVRDELDQAIFAALGENVRPVTPGDADPFDGEPEPLDSDEDLKPGYIPPGESLGSIILPPDDHSSPPAAD